MQVIVQPGDTSKLIIPLEKMSIDDEMNNCLRFSCSRYEHMVPQNERRI